MKVINLDVFERLRAQGLLLRQEGNLEKLRPYARIIERLKLSPEEKEGIGLREADGGFFWNPDAPGKGETAEVLVEEGDYAALKDLVNSWPRFSIEDIGWTEKIAEAKTVEVTVKGKK